jgi:multicomponent Na+:H+ antiporter subunit A
MAGFPIAIGFLAKEEMYLALTSGLWPDLAFLAVLIVGNALMMVVALMVAFKPFLGDLRPTPHTPHEGSLSLFIGPVILAILGVVAGLFTGWLNLAVLNPTGGSIYNADVDAHIHLAFDITNPAVWASIVTWALGAVLFWKSDAVRAALRRTGEAIGWTFDKGFDAAMFGLIRFADRVTRVLHHGRLEWYLLLMFAVLAVSLSAPLIATGSLPAVPDWPMLTFYEWGIVIIAAIGLVTVLGAHTRLTAIVALGIQGFAVAVIFMLFGAPDLSFTQFMVETLTVIILAMVMTRLHLDQTDHRELETAIRDGAVALAVGIGITLLILVVLQTELDLTLTELFRATSTPIAHGRNIVNVILVDYRAIDTLGEISVVMAAGLAILALIKLRARSSGTEPANRKTPRKRGSTT